MTTEQALQDVWNNLVLRDLQGLFRTQRPNYWQPPDHSIPIQVASAPFIVYPLTGAAASTVLTYTVPQGYSGWIIESSIVAIGGGFVDGSGQVIWRVTINGAWVQGYENLFSQIGNWAQPVRFPVQVQENDVVSVTVEVPAGQPNMPAGSTTGARFIGWLLPVGTV